MLMKDPRLHQGEPQLDRQVVTSMCGICPAGCGVDVHLAQGKIERMAPLKGHPQGIVCPRGAHAKEVVYSPDRLLYPQLRDGSGKLRRVSWDDAFGFLVDRLQAIKAEHGPEALGTYSGRGNFEFGLNEHFAPEGSVESCANAVLAPFGSPNAMGVGALCYASNGMIAPRATFGGALRNTRVDLEQAELILVWGANPATDSPPLKLRRIKRAAKAGARVVVIDHRRTATVRATGADWIPVRPGTDCALALGLMHVMIAEERYDADFVARWTHGFDELREHVEGYPPERVAKICGVTIDGVRSLARLIGRAGSVSLLTFTGLEYSNSGVQANRAVWSLLALTGKLDTPGSTQLREHQPRRTARLLTRLPEGERRALGAERYPLFYEARREAQAGLLPRAILEGEPYPVRGLIISGASMITSWPAPKLWRRALAALDLLVVIDRFPTADSRFAQLVLPATTLFETESYMMYDDAYVQLRQRVIPPLGEARNDYLIFAELARRLGYGDRWPQTEEALIEHALAPTGITLEQLREHPEGLPLERPPVQHRKWELGGLRADGQPGFETPTGKFEFASEWLRGHGYDALPVYCEPAEGPVAAPKLSRRYPLVLNTGARTQSAFRSQHLNIPSLIRKQPRPLATMHEEDAAVRGIADGDEVELLTRRGRVRFTARVGRDVARGAVEANMGGGGPLGPPAWRRANVNALTDLDNQDQLSGFPVYKALLCEVRKHRPRRRHTQAAPALVLDGRSLTIDDLVEASAGGRPIALDPAGWRRVAEGRQRVDQLQQSGEVAYGVTTGVGSQKNSSLRGDEVPLFNRRLLLAHATAVGGEPLAPEAVRAALLVQLNGFATGMAGVRTELVEALLARLRPGARLPTACSGSSVGASDLVPLAQLALSIVGADPTEDGSPVTELAAKEALSLMNSNAVGLGRGALGLVEARRLLAGFDRSLALGLEGFRGNPSIIDPAVVAAHPQPGQALVAAHLRGLLSESRLHQQGEPRFLQDPLSYRCAPQVHGAAYSALGWVWRAWQRELNTLQDNPVVDLETARARLLSCGNMDTTLLTMGLDTLRAALLAVTSISAQRLHKLHNPTFSGLPTGLGDSEGPAGGVQFLNLSHIAEAYAAQARARAQPVQWLYRGQLADGVEDHASLLPLAVAETERLIEAARVVQAIELVVACWAVKRRQVPARALGRGLRKTFRRIADEIPVGQEGERVFDARGLVDIARGADLGEGTAPAWPVALPT